MMVLNISYYPDLLSVRRMPGVVSHQECNTAQDDIEVLDWMENSHWKKVFIKLLVPMHAFTPIISNDHLFIAGYVSVDGKCNKAAYGYQLLLSQHQLMGNTTVSHSTDGLN